MDVNKLQSKVKELELYIEGQDELINCMYTDIQNIEKLLRGMFPAGGFPSDIVFSMPRLPLPIRK